jgi:ATP-dependent exoDNAse (exonuclease V) alpha subunit
MELSIAVAARQLDLHHTVMPQAPRANTPTEVLAGLVERITFHNEENGFCVLRVKARGQRDLITVLGHAAMIAAGEFVQASGTWINDRTHGVQFRASFLKATAPTTIEGIEKYLGSGMIRGIGPIYAKKLVRAFGDAVFDVIEQEPSRLREVTGIGPKRAERIIAGGRPTSELPVHRTSARGPGRVSISAEAEPSLRNLVGRAEGMSRWFCGGPAPR